MQLHVPTHHASSLLSDDLHFHGSDSDDVHFVRWRQKTMTDLATIFGDESRAVKDFDNISFEVLLGDDTGNDSHGFDRAKRKAFIRGKEQAAALLRSLLERVRIHDQVLNTERQKVEQEKAELRRAEQQKADTPSSARSITGRIFIVHGHAHDLKNAVARVVNALGLQEWILHERPDQGRTIIEKFEQESAFIDYAVVLCTADDLAESQSALESADESVPKGSLKDRARQNVIFELGYFTGKLGRGRVILIKDPGVEMPSDLSGVIYTSRADWKAGLVSALCSYSFTSDQTRKALSIID